MFYHTHTQFCVNINHRIAARGIEPCQFKPCQPLSNLQFLITEGFSVANNVAIIHKSPIDRNYCSSTRLSGDKELMWRGFEPRRKDLLSHNVPEKYFLCIAFCNRHFIAFTHSATHQRPISGKRSVQDSNLQGEQTPDRIATGSNSIMGTLHLDGAIS